MSERGKQQLGDGNDNYGKAAKEAHKAAKNVSKGIKEAGKNAAKEVAKQGADAVVNAASATVKAGAETGKAVGKIAAGTAAGGPWGAAISAAISAAWAMRHTLFKILVCLCIFIVILITCIVSLPDIIFRNITDMFSEWFGIEQSEPAEINTLDASYEDLARDVEKSVQNSYGIAVKKAEEILSDSKYDESLSEANFTTILSDSFDYRVAYILAAYSVSMEQNGTSKAELLSKLDDAASILFTVDAKVKEAEVVREEDGEEKTVKVKYVVCTIEMYDKDKILKVFNINKYAQYKNYGITCGEYVEYMAESLKKTVSSLHEK